jgi:hypothetical protein
MVIIELMFELDKGGGRGFFRFLDRYSGLRDFEHPGGLILAIGG